MRTAISRRWTFTILAAVILVAAVVLWPQATSVPSKPRIELVLVDGSRLELSQWDGKAVLVNFWATSCRTCLAEMPELVRLYERFHPKGLEVVGIAMPYDRPDYVTEMKKERPIPYTVALDPQGKAIRAFGNVRLTPTTFLFDSQGQVVYHRVGRIDFKELEQLIRQSLPATKTAEAPR